MTTHPNLDRLGYGAAIVVAVIAAGLLVPGCATEKPDPVPSAPASRGVDRVGYAYWSQHGRIVRTDADAANAMGFAPASLQDPAGRKKTGAVAVVGPDSDPRAPHWLLQFYDGFEFHQQRLASAEQASELVDSENDAESLGVKQGLAREVNVRGHKGYAWDKASNQPLETIDGGTLLANLNHAAVVWSEGEMFYALISYDEIKSSELMVVARSMKR